MPAVKSLTSQLMITGTKVRQEKFDRVPLLFIACRTNHLSAGQRTSQLVCPAQLECCSVPLNSIDGNPRKDERRTGAGDRRRCRVMQTCHALSHTGGFSD